MSDVIYMEDQKNDQVEDKNEPYGRCECGGRFEPVFFRQEETKVEHGRMIKTGRTRMACSHLVCDCCLAEIPVDDSFDGPWERTGR